MVEPIFEKINYNCKIGKIKEQIKVEAKTELLTDDVQSVLSLSSWATANESRLESGSANYSGKATFYLSYVSSAGAIKKCECGNEFSGIIKDQLITDNLKNHTIVTVDKTEVDTSGTHLAVVAYLSITIDLTACESVNALVGGNHLIVNQSEIDCVKSFGVKKGAYPIEEEFELNYSVKEVLFHRADGIITSVQSGVGSIIVDGEVLLSLVLLQNNDKNDIIRENRVVPFRMEIECEEAMPNMQAIAKVNEKSFKTAVSVDEEGARSVVNVSVNLLFEGEAFTIDALSVATDAFSAKNKVQLEYEELPFLTASEVRAHSQIVRGRAPVNELPVGASVVTVSGEKASVVSAECANGSVLVIGLVSATALLKDGDGKVFARKLEIPFEQTFDGGYDCESQPTVVVKAENASAKVTSLTEMEIESELFFTVYPSKKCSHKVIKNVNVLEEKPINDNAITVYIAQEGDELWSLAKRLNVCPEQLIETNSELQFPLTGKERIVVYRGAHKQ